MSIDIIRYSSFLISVYLYSGADCIKGQLNNKGKAFSECRYKEGKNEL